MELKIAANDLLGQLTGVIEQLSDEEFRSSLPLLGNASIGQHVRHTLEFFICLMDAPTTGVVNYDKRNHDRFIQEDTALACSVIRSINEFVAGVNTNRELFLEMSYETGTDCEEQYRVPTNYDRELAYNIEHAVHHMALMKIGIVNNFTHVALPENFGVASSTVRYNKQQ